MPSTLYITLSLEYRSEVKSLSHVHLFVTPWAVAYKAPLSMEFSRQEYWSGLPFPSPVDLPNPGFEPGSPALQADTLPSELPGKPPRWTIGLFLRYCIYFFLFICVNYHFAVNIMILQVISCRSFTHFFIGFKHFKQLIYAKIYMEESKYMSSKANFEIAEQNSDLFY